MGAFLTLLGTSLSIVVVIIALALIVVVGCALTALKPPMPPPPKRGIAYGSKRWRYEVGYGARRFDDDEH